MMPAIDQSKCDICYECIDVCPNDVFDTFENKIIVSSPEDCIECMGCVDICPTRAIYMGE
ncbi:MAG: 4Fe-4S binding protein [Syntrophorhabdaceae bacterium]|nr:4Fe-4S binding protein [Syntrophorhabdaceae bacterium]